MTGNLDREAMALYREQQLETRTRMVDIPVLLGHRPVQGPALPSREGLYDEIFEDLQVIDPRDTQAS